MANFSYNLLCICLFTLIDLQCLNRMKLVFITLVIHSLKRRMFFSKSWLSKHSFFSRGLKVTTSNEIKNFNPTNFPSREQRMNAFHLGVFLESVYPKNICSIGKFMFQIRKVVCFSPNIQVTSDLIFWNLILFSTLQKTSKLF
jgi:hypothetical protein